MESNNDDANLKKFQEQLDKMRRCLNNVEKKQQSLGRVKISYLRLKKE